MRPCPVLIAALFALGACSTSPTPVAVAPEPAWIHSPTRTVDNGYIVYVGQGQDPQAERAAFKAESIAIGDLVNECSFAPKGTRIEDRYDQVVAGIHYAYAKIGVQFEECEGAKKAVKPEEIRAMANVALADQLKRFQDMYYSADEPDESEGDNTLPAPPAEPIRDQNEYYITRQRVAYAKQVVILAPETVFVAGSPQYTTYVSRVTPYAGRLQQFETASPAVRSQPTTWSQLQTSPMVAYPKGFRHFRTAVSRPGQGAIRPYAPATHGPAPIAPQPSQWKKRKHRRWK